MTARQRAIWGMLALQLLAAPSAHAIIIRHDVDDAEYRVDPADYPALVDLFEPGDCLGTLIDPSYLLTVAHCATDLNPGDVLRVGSVSHDVGDVILHPRWTDAEAFDIALIALAHPVEGVEPVPLYRGDGEVGQTLTLLGRGVTATGKDGEPGGTDDGRLRAATNVVDDADAHFLQVTFESPGRGATPREGVGASGDSGGPAFLEIDGVRYLAGLNSWGDDCDVDVGQYGATDYQTRVSGFTAWIDAHVDTAASQPEGAPSADAREPSGGSKFGECGCAVARSDSTLVLWLGLWMLFVGRSEPRDRVHGVGVRTRVAATGLVGLGTHRRARCRVDDPADV